MRTSPAHSPDNEPIRPFAPAALRSRQDGWTPERQFAFIEKLADCGSVAAASAYVGMSRESARKLRRHPCGRAFRDAWDAALDCSYAEVEESAVERSKNGVARPVFYKGEQVGEYRHYDERLTMFLLRFRRRHRFGPEADRLLLVDESITGHGTGDGPCSFDPEGQLDGCLNALDSNPVPPSDDDDDEANVTANFANFHDIGEPDESLGGDGLDGPDGMDGMDGAVTPDGGAPSPAGVERSA